MNKKNTALHILLSIFIWLIYLSLPGLGMHEYLPLRNIETKYIISYYANNILLIILFYINYYWGVPQYLNKKKIIQYIVFVALTLGTKQALFILCTRYLLHGSQGDLNPFFISYQIFKHILIYIAAIALFYFQRYRQIEDRQTKSELEVLRHQMNPHFFFNSLNIIYSQALNHSEATAGSVAKLSGIMRYILSYQHAEWVPIEMEIKYITDYITLQKYRLTEKTHVQFTTDQHLNGFSVPPLLFINFIENAFKYGVSTEIETHINISFNYENNTLIFDIKNDRPHSKQLQKESNQMGLNNIIQRLQLIYGNKHTLNISDNEVFFHVNLKISTQ